MTGPQRDPDDIDQDNPLGPDDTPYDPNKPTGASFRDPDAFQPVFHGVVKREGFPG